MDRTSVATVEGLNHGAEQAVALLTKTKGLRLSHRRNIDDVHILRRTEGGTLKRRNTHYKEQSKTVLRLLIVLGL